MNDKKNEINNTLSDEKDTILTRISGSQLRI